MEPGKWARRIVLLHPLSDDDGKLLRLFAIDNEGKGWVMISDASTLMKGYNRTEAERLLENKWLPIKPLPRHCPDLDNNDPDVSVEWEDNFRGMEDGVYKEIVDEIGPDLFIKSGIGIAEAITLAEKIGNIVIGRSMTISFDNIK